MRHNGKVGTCGCGERASLPLRTGDVAAICACPGSAGECAATTMDEDPCANPPVLAGMTRGEMVPPASGHAAAGTRGEMAPPASGQTTLATRGEKAPPASGHDALATRGEKAPASGHATMALRGEKAPPASWHVATATRGEKGPMSEHVATATRGERTPASGYAAMATPPGGTTLQATCCRPHIGKDRDLVTCRPLVAIAGATVACATPCLMVNKPWLVACIWLLPSRALGERLRPPCC